jgi:hypothetical protein
MHACIHTYTHTHIHKYTPSEGGTNLYNFNNSTLLLYIHEYYTYHTYIHTYIHTEHTSTGEGGTNLYNFNNSTLPVIKACSDYAGGALVINVNADGLVDTGVQFYVSPRLLDLTEKGAYCPPRIVQNE